MASKARHQHEQQFDCTRNPKEERAFEREHWPLAKTIPQLALIIRKAINVLENIFLGSAGSELLRQRDTFTIADEAILSTQKLSKKIASIVGIEEIEVFFHKLVYIMITEFHGASKETIIELKRLLEQVEGWIAKIHIQDRNFEKDKKKAKDDLPIPAQSPSDKNVFICEGDTWKIRFDGITKNPKHMKGFCYLKILLENPNRSFKPWEPFFIVNNMALNKSTGEIEYAKNKQRENSEQQRASMHKTGIHVDDKIDKEAIVSIRKNLLRIGEDKKKAEDSGNQSLLNELNEEEGKILETLPKLVDKNGNPRKWADSYSQAAGAVRKAIKRVLHRLANTQDRCFHKALSEHLNEFLSEKGGYNYHPNPPVHWRIR